MNETAKKTCICSDEVICFKHLGWRRNAVLANLAKAKKKG